MNTFRLRLVTPTTLEIVDGLVSFTARDESGSFGILANAFRRMTALSFGMAAFRKADGQTEFLGLPGGVLYFVDNELKIVTTNFVRSADSAEITKALEQKIRAEEEGIREIKRSLHRLDEEVFKRLTQLTQRGTT